MLLPCSEVGRSAAFSPTYFSSIYLDELRIVQTSVSLIVSVLQNVGLGVAADAWFHPIKHLTCSGLLIPSWSAAIHTSLGHSITFCRSWLYTIREWIPGHCSASVSLDSRFLSASRRQLSTSSSSLMTLGCISESKRLVRYPWCYNFLALVIPAAFKGTLPGKTQSCLWS